MKRAEIDYLLCSVIPNTAKGVDHLLDLRQLMMDHGHPGECVRCFFDLLGDLHKPGALRPLRHWFEQYLEVEVRTDGEVLEILPVKLDRVPDLETFCQHAIDTVRSDRAYRQNDIRLRFRYKQEAVGAA